MWISKRKWDNVQNEIIRLDAELKKTENEINERILIIAEKILKQPESLLKDLDERNAIEAFVDRIIQTQ